MSDIFDQVQRLIHRELVIDLDKITIDANLFDDLNFDSLDSVELVLAAELEFDIEISDDAFDELRTVRDIVDLVQDLV
jgi:acyl carrier protein|tara:strand:- start:1031 stop:1264 length:234 start_codon:yes stop_codon:yes gene_type:complete